MFMTLVTCGWVRIFSIFVSLGSDSQKCCRLNQVIRFRWTPERQSPN